MTSCIGSEWVPPAPDEPVTLNPACRVGLRIDEAMSGLGPSTHRCPGFMQLTTALRQRNTSAGRRRPPPATAPDLLYEWGRRPAISLRSVGGQAAKRARVGLLPVFSGLSYSHLFPPKRRLFARAAM